MLFNRSKKLIVFYRLPRISRSGGKCTLSIWQVFKSAYGNANWEGRRGVVDNASSPSRRLKLTYSIEMKQTLFLATFSYVPNTVLGKLLNPEVKLMIW